MKAIIRLEWDPQQLEAQSMKLKKTIFFNKLNKKDLSLTSQLHISNIISMTVHAKVIMQLVSNKSHL